MIPIEVSEAIARATKLNNFSGWICIGKGSICCMYSLPLDPYLRMDATIFSEEGSDRATFDLCTRGPVEISLSDIDPEFTRSDDSTTLRIIQKDGDNDLEFDCGKFDIDSYLKGLKGTSDKCRHTFEYDIPMISIPSEVRTDYKNIVKLEEAILKNDFSAKEMNGLRITDKISIRALKGKIRASFRNDGMMIYVRPRSAEMTVSNRPDGMKLPFASRIIVMDRYLSEGLIIDIDPSHYNDFL